MKSFEFWLKSRNHEAMEPFAVVLESTRSCVCKSKNKCVHVHKSADKVCNVFTLFSFDPMCAASF